MPPPEVGQTETKGLPKEGAFFDVRRQISKYSGA
jgi:hypothetical protein